MNLNTKPLIASDWEQEFFLGAWNPDGKLDVTFKPSPGPQLCCIRSDRWFLLGATSPFHGRAKSLIHAVPEGLGELAALSFRGYLLDPPLHSWSDAAALLRYWTQPPQTHNGLFAVARIANDGRCLEFTTDAFGIAPLYYRTWKGVILFSTLPRLLLTDGDCMDRLAGRALIQISYLPGNLGLTEGIQRVPPGRCLTFNAAAPAAKTWFQYDQLPKGEEPITEAAVRLVEDSFQAAIDRCLQLPAASYVLPLSSGYDSRRILAALHARRVPFQAITVRGFTHEGRDLDAYWTQQMAAEFGFAHKILELPEPSMFAEDDRLRRRLTDCEALEHTWLVQLCRHLPPQDSLIFDGLAGDVLNNTSTFGGVQFHTAAEPEKLRMIARRLVGTGFDRILNEKFWPAEAELLQTVIAFLQDLPEGPNRSDLAFLLLRARRGAGVWSQTLVQSGHIPVHPYLDRDYVQTALRYAPLQKCQRTLQDRCLAEFWPRFYSYAGSRRPPPDSRAGNPRPMLRRERACLRQVLAEGGHSPLFHSLRAWLTGRGYALLLAAAHADPVADRFHWWLYPLLSLQARQHQATVCWSIQS